MWRGDVTAVRRLHSTCAYYIILYLCEDLSAFGARRQGKLFLATIKAVSSLTALHEGSCVINIIKYISVPVITMQS